MKKLISVFAALALVGSLAAQKGKKPAKAPAKPAVAAPAVPAMPAAVTAAPAAAGAAKGMGLFIEGRGAYTLSNGSAGTAPDGDVSGTSVTYKTSGAGGFGGGASIGYDLAKGLALVGSFDYRGVKSRKWEISSGGVTATRQVTKNTMVAGLGFRPHIDALGGTWYAGAGFAYVLPYEVTTDFTDSGTGTLVANLGGSGKARQDVEKWNAGMGVYGEFGYNFNVTDNFYIGLGVRALVTTANNIDKTNTVTVDGVASTTQKVAKDTVSDTTTQKSFSTDGNTDFSGAVTVGVRF